MHHFKKTRRTVFRNPIGLEIPAIQSSQPAIPPLRLKYMQVCEMLSVTRDCLRKIIESDETFPKPMKSGHSRQAAVYFDYQEICTWYQKEKEKQRNNTL